MGVVDIRGNNVKQMENKIFESRAADREPVVLFFINIMKKPLLFWRKT